MERTRTGVIGVRLSPVRSWWSLWPAVVYCRQCCLQVNEECRSRTCGLSLRTSWCMRLIIGDSSEATVSQKWYFICLQTQLFLRGFNSGQQFLCHVMSSTWHPSVMVVKLWPKLLKNSSNILESPFNFSHFPQGSSKVVEETKKGLRFHSITFLWRWMTVRWAYNRLSPPPAEGASLSMQYSTIRSDAGVV